MKLQSASSVFRVIGPLLLVLIGLVSFIPAPGRAVGQLEVAVVRLDRMKAATSTGLELTIIPDSGASVQQVRLVLPAGYGISGSLSLSTSSLDPGVAPLPGSLSASSSGQTIIISGVTALASGMAYGVEIQSVTNPAVGNYTADVETADGSGNPIELTTVGLDITASDQITSSTQPSGTSCTDADFNHDHIVNIFDLSILLSHYGTSSSLGDANGDGHVNIFDLSILLSCYGKSA